jgi:hypothetical protein
VVVILQILLGVAQKVSEGKKGKRKNDEKRGGTKRKEKEQLQEEGGSVAWCGEIPRQQNLEEKQLSPRATRWGTRLGPPFASVLLASSSRSRDLTGCC